MYIYLQLRYGVLLQFTGYICLSSNKEQVEKISTLDTFSTKPRHKEGENTESLRFTIFGTSIQVEACVCLQFQNRRTKVSV